MMQHARPQATRDSASRAMGRGARGRALSRPMRMMLVMHSSMSRVAPFSVSSVMRQSTNACASTPRSARASLNARASLIGAPAGAQALAQHGPQAHTYMPHMALHASFGPKTHRGTACVTC